MLQFLSIGKKTITNTLSIYVKTNTGSTLSVELDPKWDIKNVKEFVGPQLGIQPEEMKIIFAGKELSDNTILEVMHWYLPFFIRKHNRTVIVICYIGMWFGTEEHFACG